MEPTSHVLVVTLIGGAGTLVGPVLGAGVLQLMGYFLNIWFGPRWPLIFGIVFILIVLFVPYGLIGTWRLRGTSWKQLWRDRVQQVRHFVSAKDR